MNLVESYLNNNCQLCVKMGDCTSECLGIVYGVPQGSVLGPPPFILDINVCEVSSSLKLYLISNDIMIVTSGESLQQLLDLIPSGFSQIENSFRKKITINLNKTQILIFGHALCVYTVQLKESL